MKFTLFQYPHGRLGRFVELADHGRTRLVYALEPLRGQKIWEILTPIPTAEIGTVEVDPEDIVDECVALRLTSRDADLLSKLEGWIRAHGLEEHLLGMYTAAPVALARVSAGLA